MTPLPDRPATLFEQAAQLVMVRLGSNLPPPVPAEADAGRVAALLERYPLGGLVLFHGDRATTPGTLARLQARSRFPLLVAADIERGAGQQLRGATVFPHAMAFDAPGVTADDLTATARVTAREALAGGLHLAFAPVADVNREPRNPIIATRAFSADPGRAARHVRAYLRGCRDAGLLTTAKHFPGHGNTRTDSHAALPVVPGTREELAATDLVPFRAAVEAGVDVVMTAHVAYPGLDPSGTPATASPRILRDLLRDEMGFRGVVVTDSLLMGAAPDSQGAAAAALVAAGVDLLLDVPDPAATVDGLVRAVTDGTLPAARLAEACARVWALKERMAERFGGDVFTAPPPMPPPDDALADRVARRALTMLGAAPGAWPPDADAAAREGLMVVLVQPHRTHLDPPEAPLGAAVRAAFPGAVYAEVGPAPAAAALAALLERADTVRYVVAALVVRPAAWQAFGLRPAQHRFVEALLRRRPVALAALGSPVIFERYPGAAARLALYSDVPASQRALVAALQGA